MSDRKKIIAPDLQVFNFILDGVLDRSLLDVINVKRCTVSTRECLEQHTEQFKALGIRVVDDPIVGEPDL